MNHLVWRGKYRDVECPASKYGLHSDNEEDLRQPELSAHEYPSHLYGPLQQCIFADNASISTLDILSRFRVSNKYGGCVFCVTWNMLAQATRRPTWRCANSKC
jgi:hypothetical protein